VESLQKWNEPQFILEASPIDGFETRPLRSSHACVTFSWNDSPTDTISATISLGLNLGFAISLSNYRDDRVPALIP
jgi:hypothetical protein